MTQRGAASLMLMGISPRGIQDAVTTVTSRLPVDATPGQPGPPGCTRARRRRRVALVADCADVAGVIGLAAPSVAVGICLGFAGDFGGRFSVVVSPGSVAP